MVETVASSAHSFAPRQHTSWWRAMLPLILVLLLAACGAGATTSSGPTATPTPTPPSENLTYIGGDGNIWQLRLPEGSAVHLTTDAHPGTVTYSGLAWSPDGTLLAVLRVAHSGQSTTSGLVVLRPNGQVVLQVPLPASPYGHPFAWSPNSHYIAYRILTSRDSSSRALLVLLDARSGALHKALTYPFQQGCRGSHTPLLAAINQLHQVDGGIDTFGWAPDGDAVLASAGCSNESSVRIDLTSGAVTTGFPRGATFQPGGDFLLGVWSSGSGTPVLGLRDDTNDYVRSLATVSVTSSAHIPLLAGLAVWTANGNQIFFEHADGIWHVGADGSGARAVVAGTPLDSQHAATIELAPAIAPDLRMVVYCELKGMDTSKSSITRTWYVAAADGSNPSVLPDVTTESVWQPLP
jgi:WD40 repeat protein